LTILNLNAHLVIGVVIALPPHPIAVERCDVNLLGWQNGGDQEREEKRNGWEAGQRPAPGQGAHRIDSVLKGRGTDRL
jgi:hypothetical protein